MSAGPNPKPEHLLAYFETLAKEQPGRMEWADGARLTRRWIDLMALPTPRQEDVDDLLHDIGAQPHPGSGRIDLWLRVRHWARTVGLAVSDQYPW